MSFSAIPVLATLTLRMDLDSFFVAHPTTSEGRRMQ
jgi:hypothetical protein